MRRGDVHICGFGEPEQDFVRPALVVSVEPFHRSGLAVVAPLTSTRRPVPTSVEIDAAGLHLTPYVQVDQVRTLSQRRLGRRIGACDDVTMGRVERVLARLLGLAV